ncbi:hypothetical protein K493DRAFT_303656 [Basidiobolus meristosporus CBS 931.73]|uniref:Voltage-gated hydrogen channel 1 n=1 Tax=Basidiobolus meristosporus CBS 931.73 TaxID=1314790 RepID=A0A1Y1Y1Z8_9FUNG|nr:hypothetical protein K493DRAFT_303656 [Basidiobolus meristosporus CBS 931.73]|eukprot:ORX92032.1 hypothetical protein K493DRAFT_303656 [Basidiobolus meristosporus CBS 931.73]
MTSSSVAEHVVVDNLSSVTVEELMSDLQSKEPHTISEKIVHIMESQNFHYTIISLVLLDLVIVLTELVLSLYEAEGLLLNEHALQIGQDVLFALSLSILGLFMLEIVLKLIFMGIHYFLNFWGMLDLIVVVTSFVLEVYFHVVDDATHKSVSSAIILFRFWKILRVIHAVAHSVESKNRQIIDATNKEKIRAEKRVNMYKTKYKKLREEHKQLQIAMEALRMERYVNLLPKLDGLECD